MAHRIPMVHQESGLIGKPLFVNMLEANSNEKNLE